MFGVRRKRLNLDHQDQSWDREGADMETGRDTPGMSAARQASKSSSCSSGESGLSDSGGPWNKCPLSCFQANGGPQSATAELAEASKIPHREKSSLAPKSNKVHPAPYHNKHRQDHVKDRVLSRSTQEGASKPPQSKDILQMKRVSSKTNIPGIMEFGSPSSAMTRDYFLGGATRVPRLSRFDVLSSESEEEETDEEWEQDEEGEDDLCATCWDTYRERDLISFPRTVSRNAHSRHCLQSLKYIPSPLPESLAAPNKVSGGCVAFSRQLQKFQNGSQPSRTNLASSHRSQTSATNTLQSSLKCCGQLGDLNVHDEADTQDCQAAQEGATAAQKSQSLQDSNKDTVCRLNQRLSNEEIPCRICYCGDSSPDNPLLSPCLCSGSVQFIHFCCLKRWIEERIESGSELNIVKRCEICKEVLTLDWDTFDLNGYYKRRRREHQVIGLCGFTTRTFDTFQPSPQGPNIVYTALRHVDETQEDQRVEGLSPETTDI